MTRDFHFGRPGRHRYTPRDLPRSRHRLRGSPRGRTDRKRPGAGTFLRHLSLPVLPGLVVAQDVYLRAGLDLSRPADTHFTDADCASLVPAALYGCGAGDDGVPLRSVGDVGTVAGVELGLGYAVAPGASLLSWMPVTHPYTVRSV